MMIGYYGYQEQVANRFRYEAIDHTDIQRVHVNVYPFEESGEHFSLEYEKDGRLASSIPPDILDFSSYTDFLKETKRTFMWFTHEERAAYSQAYIPKVEAAMQLNPYSNDVLLNYNYTRCVYGIPNASCIAEDEAKHIANRILFDQFGCSSEWIRGATCGSYFDVTDEHKPLWKFYLYNANDFENRKYVIRLAAQTGEVVEAFEWTDACAEYEKY